LNLDNGIFVWIGRGRVCNGSLARGKGGGEGGLILYGKEEDKKGRI